MNDPFDDQEPSSGGFVSHIPAILRQRRWVILVPVMLMLASGVAAAFLIPPTYRSSAMLVVEARQVPTDPGVDGGSESIDQRIAKVRQQVLSRPNLVEIIQKYNLYQAERTRQPLSAVLEKMRDAVLILPLNSQNQQSTGSSASTIAFSMSFDYPDATHAQSVAQDLVERILNVDSTKSADQAAGAVQFLEEQARALQTQMSQVQQQIFDIKARNGQVLSSTGMTMMGGSSGAYEAQIAALQRDNNQAMAQRAASRSAAALNPALVNAEAQLAAARAIYSESHPDVIFAKQRLAEARALASKTAADAPGDTTDQQIAANNAQISALRSAMNGERAQAASVMSAQSRAPVVLEQVSQLQQKLEGLNTQYQQTSAKLTAAQTGARLDSEQLGERLSIVDPPVVPDNPVSPNRPLIVLGALAAGLIIGLAAALAVELALQPIRGFDTVRTLTGQEPIGAVPVLVATRPRKGWRSWLRRGRRPVQL